MTTNVPINKRSQDFLELSSTFEREFHQSPDFFVKTPGRVNLIGEHIDYCGYPVLPMAIAQNIQLAIKITQDGVLHLRNANPKYQSFKCAINSFEIPLPDGPPEWFKYFLCGVKGAAEDLVNNSSLHGMMVLVSGNIPPASGLSSSSALVCSAVLAVSYANELSLDKQKLASTAARCERYIGTQGGGMDQAIALLATKNTAQYIEWNPLKATAIRLPSNAFFVIANSLSEMNKAATSDFNQRVVECRLGARLLAKKAALNWRDTEKFAVLQKTLNYTLPEMIDMAKECLKELYSRQDLMKEFRITEQELEDLLLTPNTKTAQVFNIRQRALHVFEEAHRVELFREAAERGDLTEMQFLMRDSHRSLTDLYECSHKNLDELVRLADNGVAKVGARLTGAGWGGCIIALCNSVEQTRLFIEDLKANYYSKLPNIQGRSYENYVFVSSPQAGAEILL